MTMKRIGPAILFSTLVLFAVTVLSAPSGDSDSSSSEESSEDTELIYDQRQNGSQNFRLQMSDVMLILAPAETLLSIGGTDLLELGDDKATGGHGCGADDKLKCKSHSVKRTYHDPIFSHFLSSENGEERKWLKMGPQSVPKHIPINKE